MERRILDEPRLALPDEPFAAADVLWDTDVLAEAPLLEVAVAEQDRFVIAPHRVDVEQVINTIVKRPELT